MSKKKKVEDTKVESEVSESVEAVEPKKESSSIDVRVKPGHTAVVNGRIVGAGTVYTINSNDFDSKSQIKI